MKLQQIPSYLAVFGILCFLPIVSFASDFANDAAVKKYKNYTPEQIRSLSDDERQKSVPIVYTWAAQRGLAIDAKLAIAMDLNTLMYLGVANYEKAIKSFQIDMGDKPTGVLSVWQIVKLQERAETQKLGTVGFPEDFSSFITKDSAQIRGTATILDEKILYPINHVTVSCYRERQYCEAKQLILKLPDDNSWAQMYHFMDRGTDIYKITRWEGDEIDAVNNDGCRTVSLNYNFKTKEFFETIRNTDKECDILGEPLPKLSKPRISQIVDGQNIIKAEFSKIRERAYSYLASDFRKQVDDIIKKENSSR